MNVVIVTKASDWADELMLGLSVDQSNNYIKLTKCTEEALRNYNPDWVFFFHWSELVPETIYSKYRCAVIHTSNLPSGRGGSPLQNQILEGVLISKVNVIEMVGAIDAGGVYCSQQITLQGSINDIWMTVARIASSLITHCVLKSPIPVQQEGAPTIYKRITNNSIDFTNQDTVLSIYDQIRMVDSDNYPNAYIEIGGFRLTFSRAKLLNKEVLADVRICKK